MDHEVCIIIINRTEQVKNAPTLRFHSKVLSSPQGQTMMTRSLGHPQI